MCLHGRNARMSMADLETSLKDVKETISSSDFSIVNLETSITCEVNQPIVKSGPVIVSDARVLDLVKYIGFDGLTLANNHFGDLGARGVVENIELIKASGLWYVGAGENAGVAAQLKYLHIGGQTIAVINCCEHEFTIATDEKAGCNALNPIQQYYAIRQAKEEADYLIAIVHGGHEHYQLPSPRMQETYRFFIDAGADVVVNHHQHCYSGYEKYKDKFIFYGLGNFLFDWEGRSPTWDKGCVLELVLEDTVSFRLIPYEQNISDFYSSKIDNDSACKQLIAVLSGQQYEDFFLHMKELNAIICNPHELQKHWQDMAKRREVEYKAMLKPTNTKWMKRLLRISPSKIKKSMEVPYFTQKRCLELLNGLQCESHKDILQFLLTNCED